MLISRTIAYERICRVTGDVALRCLQLRYGALALSASNFPLEERRGVCDERPS
jgi:hypothetical protein